jgi:hypothetical protein
MCSNHIRIAYPAREPRLRRRPHASAVRRPRVWSRGPVGVRRHGTMGHQFRVDTAGGVAGCDGKLRGHGMECNQRIRGNAMGELTVSDCNEVTSSLWTNFAICRQHVKTRAGLLIFTRNSPTKKTGAKKVSVAPRLASPPFRRQSPH